MASHHRLCQVFILSAVVALWFAGMEEVSAAGSGSGNRRLLQAPPALTFPGFPPMTRFPFPSLLFPPMFPSPVGSGNEGPSTPAFPGFGGGSGRPSNPAFPGFGPRLPGTPNPSLPNAPAAPAFTLPNAPAAPAFTPPQEP